MATRILQAPYSLVRRAKRVIAREVDALEEGPAGQIVPFGGEPPQAIGASAAMNPAETEGAGGPDAVVMPGEVRPRSHHRRPRYRLAVVGSILSTLGSMTALTGLALEDAPIAQIGAGTALLTAVAAVAFAWRSRMKSRIMEWALAAGAVAVLMTAAVVVLGDGEKPTEPEGKPTTVSPGARQQQG